jgi:hypothetical protein
MRPIISAPERHNNRAGACREREPLGGSQYSASRTTAPASTFVRFLDRQSRLWFSSAMPTRRTCVALAAIVVPALATSPATGAPRAEHAMVNSYIPARIDAMIGFIPSHGMNPPG